MLDKKFSVAIYCIQHGSFCILRCVVSFFSTIWEVIFLVIVQFKSGFFFEIIFVSGHLFSPVVTFLQEWPRIFRVCEIFPVWGIATGIDNDSLLLVLCNLISHYPKSMSSLHGYFHSLVAVHGYMNWPVDIPIIWNFFIHFSFHREYLPGWPWSHLVYSNCVKWTQ